MVDSSLKVRLDFGGGFEDCSVTALPNGCKLNNRLSSGANGELYAAALLQIRIRRKMARWLSPRLARDCTRTTAGPPTLLKSIFPACKR
jgi:hypothetical protein